MSETTATLDGRIRAALNTTTTLHPKTFDPDIPREIGQNSTKPGSKPPAPIGPISARRHVRDLLTELIAMRVDETNCSHPERTSIPELGRWVLQHSTWYAAHDTGSDTAYELEQAARLYEQITTPPAGKWVTLGACPVVHDAHPCGGTVKAWLPTGEEHDVLAGCDLAREHTWTRGEWTLLARLQGDEAPAMLDRVQLAAWLCDRLGARVTQRHVWNWVRRHEDVAAMQDEQGRLDRVRFALWWLERRERIAA